MTRKRQQFNKTQGVGKYFPFTKVRFNTEGLLGRNYPSTGEKPNGWGKRSERIPITLSHQERLMLEGLANSFQCSEGEALRILLHHFAKGLKDGSITRICGRQRISQEKLANEWLAEKRESGEPITRKNQNLHAAAEKALDEAYDRAQERYDARGVLLEQLAADGSLSSYRDESTGRIDGALLDDLLQAEIDMASGSPSYVELMELEPEERRRVFIDDYLETCPDATREEAEAAYEDEWDGFDELDEEDLDFSGFDC